MRSTVHGYSWKRNASGAVAITSAGRAHVRENRGKNSKENVSVCLNCKNPDCKGTCAMVRDARK